MNFMVTFAVCAPAASSWFNLTLRCKGLGRNAGVGVLEMLRLPPACDCWNADCQYKTSYRHSTPNLRGGHVINGCRDI